MAALALALRSGAGWLHHRRNAIWLPVGRGCGRAASPFWARPPVIVVALLVVGTFAFSSCSAITKIRNAIHDVRGNKAVIDGFNSKLNAAPTTFEAVYAASGSASATVTYAAQIPNDVAFSLTPSGGRGNTAPVHLVQNSSGEYACEQASGQWSCDKVSGVGASSQNALIDLYTPGHWVRFLSLFALAAGIAGDRVTTSTMSLNGFSMNCIDLATPGHRGHEHRLHDQSGRARLRPRRRGFDQLRHHQLLVVTTRLALPTAAGFQNHHGDGAEYHAPGLTLGQPLQFVGLKEGGAVVVGVVVAAAPAAA